MRSASKCDCENGDCVIMRLLRNGEGFSSNTEAFASELHVLSSNQIPLGESKS